MKEKLTQLIEKLKKEFGKNFRQDNNHSWKFEILTESRRSQVVTLIFKEKYHSEKNISRFIAFSPIGPIFKHFNFEHILRMNSDLDIGTIAIEDLKNQEGIQVPYLVFRASHLFVTADYPEIWELIIKTGEYADKLEKDIFSKDSH